MGEQVIGPAEATAAAKVVNPLSFSATTLAGGHFPSLFQSLFLGDIIFRVNVDG
ncbi:hypothetical protein D3C85_1610570 [compost metagenome]